MKHAICAVLLSSALFSASAFAQQPDKASAQLITDTPHSGADDPQVYEQATLAVIRVAAENRGYTIEGFAPTSRAAPLLAETGVGTGTLQGFLARGTNRETSEKRHFYFVDESSLASTNQIREFLSRLGSQERVLLIGDTRQHQGVEAGRPFEQLQKAGMRTAHLDEIVRQKGPALKSAVESLAKGDVSAALGSLHSQGRIREISTLVNASARSPASAVCPLGADLLFGVSLGASTRPPMEALRME
jgi:hypothetical protein